MRKKICDMDCFNCPYPDCINNSPSYSEKSLYKNRSEESKRQQREYNRQRSAMLKAAGLCTCCGQRPAWDGHRECMECYLRHSRRAKERYAERGRQRQDAKAAKIAAGVCIRLECERPAVPGKRLCQEHCNQYGQYLQKGRAVLAAKAAERKAARMQKAVQE